MSTWNTAFEALPPDVEDPSLGASRIRTLKSAIRERLIKEHKMDLSSGLSTEDGFHLAGSAVAYHQAAAPTQLPDASTALGATHKGRMWYDDTLKALKVWDGSAFQFAYPMVHSTSSKVGIGRDPTTYTLEAAGSIWAVAGDVRVDTGKSFYAGTQYIMGVTGVGFGVNRTPTTDLLEVAGAVSSWNGVTKGAYIITGGSNDAVFGNAANANVLFARNAVEIAKFAGDNHFYTKYLIYPGLGNVYQGSHYLAGNTVGIGVDRTPALYAFEVTGDGYFTSSIVALGSLYVGANNKQITGNATGVGVGRSASANAFEVEGAIYSTLAMIPTGGITENGVTLKRKVINIGDWNMDATSTVSVAHGVTSANIRHVSVLIRADTGTNVYNLTVDSTPSVAGYWYFDSTYINLGRLAGGGYDNTNFDATSFNRGYIYIDYVA